MKIICRRAEMKDLPSFAPMVASMIADAGKRLPFKVGPVKPTGWFIDTFLRSENGICFAAFDAGMVVGWLGAIYADYPFSEEKFVQIQTWAVMPGYRGKGIGGELYSWVRAWAKGKGSKIITIGVNQASSSNPDLARNKLESLGFKEFERAFYVDL